MEPKTRPSGVDLEALLSLDPKEGRISLGRERMVLISADAMGNLRRELWDALGPALASEVLFRFGNRCGREEAERLLPDMNLEDPVEALRVGPLLHAFEGVARVEESRLEIDPETGNIRGSGKWVGSYEADQHLRLFGPADTPVCQTLAGYASGFASAVLGKELLCRETSCRGSGATYCQWVLSVADSREREELPQHLRSAYHALEARVRSSEALLETVRASTTEALYTLDEGGNITSWSRGAREAFGFSVDDVLGRHERLLFPPDLVESGESARLREAMAGGSMDQDDVRRQRADGTTVRGREERRPILDSSGGLLGATVVLRRSEAVSEAERTLHALLDNVPDGIAVATMDQRIVEGNRAFRRMLGLPEEGPFPPTTCFSLMANLGNPCADCPSASVIHDSSTTQCHPSFVRPDGQRIYFDLRSFPLRNAEGAVTHELKYVRDVTHEMERDVALEESRRLAAVGEMAARVAHEVKNPLAGMRGALQVLAKRRPDEDPDKEILHEVIEHIDRLDTTVRDLLSFSRPSSLRQEVTDAMDVAEAAVNLLKAAPEMRDINLQIESEGEGAVAALDRQQVVQVLTNLIINAAQALRPGDDRTIVLRTAPTDEGVQFSVEDHGPGVPPELRTRIFSPFFTTKTRGTGLGLPICRKIVEAHRGTLDVESLPDGGTAFFVRLPRRAPRPLV